MSEDDVRELRLQLQFLKDWPVGLGSTFTDVGNKMLAAIELNLKIAEMLLDDAERP